MSTFQARRPAGVPTGGQFAPQHRPEPGFELDAEPGPGGNEPVLPPGPLHAAPVIGGRVEVASARVMEGVR